MRHCCRSVVHDDELQIRIVLLKKIAHGVLHKMKQVTKGGVSQTTATSAAGVLCMGVGATGNNEGSLIRMRPAGAKLGQASPRQCGRKSVFWPRNRAPQNLS